MISNILKKLFGDKSAKDQKQYQPAIDASNKFSAEFLSISDDELRGKTAKFKKLIQEGTAELEKELKSLKDKAADISTSIHDKEDLFELIDKKTKTVLVQTGISDENGGDEMMTPLFSSACSET